MNRISVTTLESFRRFIYQVSDWDTEERFIETLTGEFKGNDKTRVGGGFHKLIEGDFWVHGTKPNQFLGEEIIFTREQAEVAFSFREAHPLMVHELDLDKIYETTHGLIQVSGRIDGMEGLTVHDHKCKFRKPEFTEYIESAQWKFYLDMLNAEVFQYNIFEVKGFSELEGTSPFVLPEKVVFVPAEPLICTRYNRLSADVHFLLQDFLDYVVARGFKQYLKPAREASAIFS